MEPEFVYKFLEEKPLEIDESNAASFGHESLIETLHNIIQKCISPFTIGLFGKWGSGKSTIAENLKTRLLKNKIPTIIFDVWKHEGDALRRTFLIETVEQFNNIEDKNIIPQKITLDERALHGKTDTDQQYRFNKKRLWFHTRILLLFSACIIAPLLFIWLLGLGLFNYNIFQSLNFGSVSGVLIAVFSSTLVYKYADQFVEQKKSESKKDRFQDPHEFEKEFINLINKVAAQKILIIFDNIDRVSGENAVKIISTIKTFLEPSKKSFKTDKQIIFLIPCDVVAIKGHLVKVFKEENLLDTDDAYAEEFLRKFFNTIIWIPEFYQIELEKFARRKLRETLIPEFDNEYLAWLITQVFKQNPRQIIQFINVLIANYILFKMNSDAESLDKNFYKDNLPQLAKYLLLLQRFPKIIEYFKEKSIFNIQDSVSTLPPISEASINEFKKFMDETDLVKIDSLEPFITYRRSDDERAIPGVTSLLVELQAKPFDIEKAKGVAQQLNIEKHIDEFGGIIKDYLRNKTNSISGTIFLNNLFLMTQQLKLRLDETVYVEIENKLNNQNWKQKLFNIDPENIEQEFYAKFKRPDYKKRLTLYKGQLESIRAYYNKVEPNVPIDFPEKCIKEMLVHLILIPADLKLEYVLVIGESCFSNLNIVGLLVKNSAIQKEFCNSKFVINCLISLTLENFESKSEEDKLRFDLLNQIDFSYRPDTTDTGFVVLNNLINISAIEAKDDKTKEAVIKNALLLLNRLLPYPNSLDNSGNLSGFVKKIVEIYDRNKFNFTYLAIPFVFAFRQGKSNSPVRQLAAILEDFYKNLSKISLEKLDFILENIPNKQDFFSIPEYEDQLIAFSSLNSGFFQKYLDYTSNEQRYKIISKMITANLFDQMDILFKNESLIPDFRRINQELLNKLVSETNEVHIFKIYRLLDITNLEKEKRIETINKGIRITNPSASVSSLKELQNTSLLDDSEKKIIINDFCEWLRTIDIRLFLRSLDFIFTGFESYISEGHKSDLGRSLFDKVILRTSNETEFNMAIIVIKKMEFQIDESLKQRMRSRRNQVPNMRIKNVLQELAK